MEEEKIIIKKIKKGGHGGAHGGSWKVAYADFVTAMMAFFLLLWLISMVAPEKQAAVSKYFQHFNVFDKSGSSFMEGSAVKIMNNMVDPNIPKPGASPQIKEVVVTVNREDELSGKLKKEIEEKLADVKDQVLVDTFQGGVRIEMVDKDGSPMFPLGSSSLTIKAKEIIRVISKDITVPDSKIVIEGHTDALSYSTNRYTNWELSTERASAARKELERCGLNPDRIIRVSGHAATELLIKDKPYDPRNRRISILIFNSGVDPADKKPSSAQPEVIKLPPIS